MYLHCYTRIYEMYLILKLKFTTLHYVHNWVEFSLYTLLRNNDTQFGNMYQRFRRNLPLPSLSLMGVAGSSKTWILTYKTTRHHTSIGQKLNSKYVRYNVLMNRKQKKMTKCVMKFKGWYSNKPHTLDFRFS